MPETALVMNETAHDVFVGLDYYETGTQQKESMRLMKMMNKDPNDIIQHAPNLVVNKPLKSEFADKTYLGGSLLSFFKSRLSHDLKEEQPDVRFIGGLKTLRQSAFDKHWNFKVNDENNWQSELNNNDNIDIEAEITAFIAEHGNVGIDSFDQDNINHSRMLEKIQKWFHSKKAEQAKVLWRFLVDGGKIFKINREILKKHP